MTDFLTQRDIATILMDLSAIALIVGIFSQTAVMRKQGRREDLIFFNLLVVDLFIAVFDIMTYLADEKDFPGARFFNMFGITMFYLGMVFFSLMWFFYTMVRFGDREPMSSPARKAFYMPGLIMMILILINVFTGFIFSVDAGNTYHRGILFIPMYIIITFYLFSAFFNIFRYRRVTGRRKELPVGLYLLPFVLTLVVPFVLGGVSMAPVCVASGLVFTHIGVMNERAAYNM